MPTFINEILKGVGDDELLSHEMDGVSALHSLIEEYMEYRKRYDATLPPIDDAKTGKDLKNAFIHVPPKVRLRMFANYIRSLDEGYYRNSIVDEEDVYMNSPMHDEPSMVVGGDMDDEKKGLLKLLVYSFLILGILLVLIVIYMAFAGIDNTTGANVFITFLNGMVELLRVLFGI